MCHGPWDEFKSNGRERDSSNGNDSPLTNEIARNLGTEPWLPEHRGVVGGCLPKRLLVSSSKSIRVHILR